MVEAVRSGELDEAVLDESVRRILRIVFKAAETPKGGAFDVDAHHALARKIAAEGHGPAQELDRASAAAEGSRGGSP